MSKRTAPDLYTVFNQWLLPNQRAIFRKALAEQTNRHSTTIYDWIKGETRPSPAEQKIVVAELNKILPQKKSVTVEKIFS